MEERNEEDDGNEGQAISTPDPEDQVKSAIEHVDDDELTVGEEPKTNTNPSPLVECLEELDDEEEELDDE